MDPLDPARNAEPTPPDPFERISLLVASAVLVLLLFWSIDGLRNLELEGALQWAWGAIAVGSALAWFSLLAALRSPRPLERLGLVPATLRATLWGCIGIAALSHGLDSLILWIAPEGSPSLAATREALGSLPSRQLPFVLAAAAGVTPMGEELFFRGLIQRGIARRAGPALAIAVAAVLFGVAHGEWLYGAAACVLGVGLGVLVQQSGSLLPALAAHATNNFIAVLETSGRIATPNLAEAPAAAAFAGIGVGVLALWWAGGAQRPD